MFDIDLIIPCYGRSEIINRGLASIATQWKREYIHVTLVNDCSPNTDCNYQDLIDRYKDTIDIRVITMPKNSGQGLTRQFGIDNTKHDWFMFMDEDDMIGSGISISLFAGNVEAYTYQLDENNVYILDNKGNKKPKKNQPKLAVVSGPLFSFDDSHTEIIKSDNHIWLNSKLYNRKFIEKHNIRFNEPQSRHAEDYFWGTCLFYCLDHDPEYCGIMLDNDSLYYIWYPNERSQSRKDPYYGYMLSGYTMDGSKNILRFIKNCKTIDDKENSKADYRYRSLNYCVYAYYTFLAFIDKVKTSDYIPEQGDWDILRSSCKWLKENLKKTYKTYSYIEVISELVHVKDNSDVLYAEPWYTFDDYILGEVEEFEWDFKHLLAEKGDN